MAPPCAICNSADAQYCKQCHSITYCSPRCQKTDWPCHKLLCQQYNANQERPSPNHRRAILFPEDTKPAFVWVEVTEKFEDYEDGFLWDLPSGLDKYLGCGFGSLGRLEFERNLVRKRELPKVIEVWMRDNFLSDGSRPNQSVRTVTKGTAKHDWRGPLVVLKYVGLGGMYAGNGKYTDMDLRDLRDTADFFMTYPYEGGI